MKKFYLLTLSLLCLTGISRAQLLINEYSASNISTIADNYGNYEDWIELYNTSGSAVNLAGWYLSDNVSNPTKWQFTSGTIAAHGVVLVFASNNNIITGGFYHTNFTLTQMKPEHLLLTNSGGTIIDSFQMQPTKVNHSKARITDGNAVWGTDTTPTPGSSNTSVFMGYCTMPAMSYQGGFYPGAISLSMSCPDPNTEIRYTTNGLEPNIGSTLYSGPISISATQMIRACSFPINGSNYVFSHINTNTYFINENFTLPVISFGGDYNTLFSGPSNNGFTINSSIEYWDKNKVFQFKGYGLTNPHGNDSWAFPQKGFDFDIMDEMGINWTMPYDFFPNFTPRNEYDHIIMKAAANDNYPFGPSIYGVPGAHIRDAFVQSYAQRHHLEVDCRTYAPAICYINGVYWGVYEIREKHDNHEYTTFYYDQKKKDDDILMYWGGLTIRYGSDTAWNNLYTFMTTNNLNIPSNFQHVDDRLNLKSVMDYMIYCTYIVDSDWLDWNTEWWRGRHINNSGRNKWTYDLWDMDNTYNLGQNYTGWPTTTMNAGPCDVAAVYTNTGPQMGHMDMLNALLATDTFKSMYIQRYADLMNTTLRCDSVISYLDTIIGRITPEMPGQINRWGGTMAGWQNNVQFLRTQVMQRCQTIDSLINGCYQTTGPYNVTVRVSPSGGGDVKVNTTIPSAYPYTGQYFGGVKLWFHAVMNGTGQTFDHWEVNHHTINNSALAPDMYLNLTQDDTVTAFFHNSVPLHNLTVEAYPCFAGNVQVNGNPAPACPYTSTYPVGQVLTFTETPNPTYQFQYWESAHHLFNPSATSTSPWFAFQETDTVFAHFVSLTGVNNLDPVSGVGADVYPSLNEGQFFIEYKVPEPMPCSLGLYSLSGEKLVDLLPTGNMDDATKKKISVDLRPLGIPDGMYFVQLSTPSYHHTYKIVVQKN